MIDNLTKEIIKRILSDVGAVPEHFGERGLTDDNFSLAKKIAVQYEDGPEYHMMYSGQLKIGDSVLRGLLTDLTVDSVAEYLFVFRVDDLPIHAIRMVYVPDVLDTDCYIRIQKEEGTWFTPSVEIMAKMLVEFEKIVSYGLLWNDCTANSDLYDVAVSLINKE